jgi:uncharacterized membrane protein
MLLGVLLVHLVLGAVTTLKQQQENKAQSVGESAGGSLAQADRETMLLVKCRML